MSSLPSVGVPAPNFQLVASNLEILTLDMFVDKHILLNIIPSIDTKTCLSSTKYFFHQVTQNELFGNTIVITVSRDTPFAFTRVCDLERMGTLIRGSDQTYEFGKTYGCAFVTGPYMGLLSRSIVLINADRFVVHTEQVKEISQEPNYQDINDVLKMIS